MLTRTPKACASAHAVEQRMPQTLELTKAVMELFHSYENLLHLSYEFAPYYWQADKDPTCMPSPSDGKRLYIHGLNCRVIVGQTPK